VGQPCGWNQKLNTLIPWTDEQRKLAYIKIREGSTLFARLCNSILARKYSIKILKIEKGTDLAKAFAATSYVEILKSLGVTQTPLSGDVLSQSEGETNSKLAGEHAKSLLRTGNRQLSTFRTDGTYPIPIRADGVALIKEGKDFCLVTTLFGKAWADAHGLDFRVAWPLRVKPRDKAMAGQLDRIQKKEWKLLNARIRRNERGRTAWEVQIVTSYAPAPIPQMTDQVILGVDLGVSIPACVHVRDVRPGAKESWPIAVGRGKELLAVRNVIRSRIVMLLKGLRSKDSLLSHDVREAAKEQLRDLRRRERRVMKTATQRLAARIAEIAKRHGAGRWQVEDLRAGIKEGKPWLARNWAPGMLLDALKWQAQKLGADYKAINPRYTSQRCSGCGHIDAANRPDQKTFQCVRCHRKENADRNAARNISTPDIDHLIDNSLQPSGA